MQDTELKELIQKNAVKTLQWVSAQRLYQFQLQSLDDQVRTQTSEYTNLSLAEKVLADTIAHCSAETKNNIEAFLSLSLQKIFQNDEIRIELLQEVKRDRIETQVILHEGEISGPPSKIAGGGVQNVIGFLLRFLVLRRLSLKPILILDEAFRNVSANHLDALCSFLKHLTQDHGLSILLVTHEPAFMKIADAVYEVAKTPSQGLKIINHHVTVRTVVTPPALLGAPE